MKYSDFIQQVSDVAEANGDYAIIDLLPRVVFTRRISTMATNATNVFVNPDYLDTLTIQQIIGVLFHEMMHDLYGHHTLPWAIYNSSSGMSQKGYHDLVNIAMDIVINDVVRDNGYSLPQDGAFREKFDIPDDVRTSHEIFKILLKDVQDRRNQQAIQQALQQMAQEQEDNEKVANQTNAVPSSSGYAQGSDEDQEADQQEQQSSSNSSSSSSGNSSKSSSSSGSSSNSKDSASDKKEGNSDTEQGDEGKSEEQEVTGDDVLDRIAQTENDIAELSKRLDDLQKQKESQSSSQSEEPEEAEGQDVPVSGGQQSKDDTEDGAEGDSSSSQGDNKDKQDNEQGNGEGDGKDNEEIDDLIEQTKQQLSDKQKELDDLQKQKESQSSSQSDEGDSDGEADTEGSGAEDENSDDNFDEEGEGYDGEGDDADFDENDTSLDSNDEGESFGEGDESSDDKDSDEGKSNEGDSSELGSPSNNIDAHTEGKEGTGKDVEGTEPPEEEEEGLTDEELQDQYDNAPSMDDIQRSMLGTLGGSELRDRITQITKAPRPQKLAPVSTRTWVDEVFSTAGHYLVNTNRLRTYQRPSRRPSWGFPGSDLATPMKGSRVGDYKPRAFFYIDVSGSMYGYNLDKPNMIRESLALRSSLLRDTKSVVIPFDDEIYQEIDISMIIPLKGGGTDLRLVVNDINSRQGTADVFVVVTDCSGYFDVDQVDFSKMLIVVTDHPNSVAGTPRNTLKVIGVSSF